VQKTTHARKQHDYSNTVRPMFNGTV